MHDLLELILKNITTYPDEVHIEMANEDGREVYTIAVHPDDMGRVIGKNGKVIQAIRSLAHVIAIRQNKHFRINLADSGNPPPATQPGSAEDAEAVPAESEDDVLSGAIDMNTIEPEAETEK